jgi:hypothetical protein
MAALRRPLSPFGSALVGIVALALAGFGGLGLGGCLARSPAGSTHPVSSSASSSVEPLAQPAPASRPSQASDQALGRAAGALQKSYTGQEKPSLVVHNAYPKAQHVFIDWSPAGTLAPGATSSFELSPGVHSVTSADSADPNDNPSSLTEAFEPKFTYRYEILAK